MSWEINLLDATFRGVPLEVMSDSMRVRRAQVLHGMPYKQGDTVEDLGREARVFTLRVVLNGDNYEAALQTLATALDIAGSGELIHPIYGSINVSVGDWEVSHDAERPDYAEVALTFIESEAEPEFFQRTFQTVEGAVTIEADATDWRSQVRDLLSRVDSLVAWTQGYLGGGWVGLTESLLLMPGIGMRLGQLRSQVLGVLSGVAEVSGSSVTSFDPFSSPEQVPVELRSLLSDTVPLQDEGIDVRSVLSGGLIPSEVPGGDDLPALPLRVWTDILDAARRGTASTLDYLPTGLPDEPTAAQAYGLVALTVTEHALLYASVLADVLDVERVAPTLTPQDVDRMTAQARSLLQSAIGLHRQLYGVEQALQVIEPLRNVAALLQAGARRVILAKPPLTSRTVPSDTCLRGLAHLWYSDHSRATELLRLNPGLRRPYLIQRGEVLRAYSV